MNYHLKKIKIFFSLAILLLIATMISGGFMLKRKDFFEIRQLAQTINYLKYKVNFAQIGDKNLTASVLSIFQDTNSISASNDNAKSIPVLLYHGIIEKPDGSNVLLKNFKDQMFALKKAGWQTVGIEDFYQFMREGKNLSDKSFLLTFDDGRKDSYYPVDPILKALDYRAVMYVITGRSLDEKKQEHIFHLNKKELDKMSKSGRWDLQPHTRNGHDLYIDDKGNQSHYYSSKFWLKDLNRLETKEEFENRIHEDFLQAKQDIESNFNIKAISFSFPFGDFGQHSDSIEIKKVILSKANSIYNIGFYQNWPGKDFYFNYPNKDFLLKRIEVDPQWNDSDLLTTLERSEEKLVPYQDNFNKDNGWQKGWGNMNFRDDSIIMSANASGRGSTVFLDGSYLWQDYIFKADVHPMKGQVFSLTARYQDGENYVSCSFSDTSIRVEQVLNGENKVLSELKDNFVLIGKNRKIGIGVYGNTVNCYLDDKIAMKGYNLDQELNHGGIGFKTWDPLINNSELIVKNVSVEEIK